MLRQKKYDSYLRMTIRNLEILNEIISETLKLDGEVINLVKKLLSTSILSRLNSKFEFLFTDNNLRFSLSRKHCFAVLINILLVFFNEEYKFSNETLFIENLCLNPKCLMCSKESIRKLFRTKISPAYHTFRRNSDMLKYTDKVNKINKRYLLRKIRITMKA
jgi:hypothetical protein